MTALCSYDLVAAVTGFARVAVLQLAYRPRVLCQDRIDRKQ